MTVRNFKLDPVTGDLMIAAGNLVLIGDGPAVAQAVGCALRMFLGEWFLDTSRGVPWFQRVLVKSPSANVLRSVFLDVILGVQGVAKVTQLNLQYSKTTRTLSVAWAAITDTGALISDTTVLSMEPTP